MTKYDRLLSTTTRYIKAKQTLTLCMQEQFKQLCQRCKFYTGCPVYCDYVDAWIKLQKVVK